jgi:hexosaminidase
MRALATVVLLVIFLCTCFERKKLTWTLVPYPNDITIQPGAFSFHRGVSISYNDRRLEPSVGHFKENFEKLGINATDKSINRINLEIADSQSTSDEGYELIIGSEEIKVIASHPKGVFYGLMTIWQQLSFSDRMEIPKGRVKDAPRYEYRGFMLDESRHLFGKEKVKQLLDVMSFFKLNTFHWHLTDAPGWRIEIKAFPKLATVGGKGNISNPDAPAQFYSQEEIADIVAYAADRYITIVPEIDMPGHATAANRAYPEFSGGGGEKRPDFTFNPGKEETYEYLTTILGEVSELFPSPYIHFGGDEVHFGNEQWGSDESIKALMKREQLSELKEVEQYFSRRMAGTIQALGKITGGWGEVVDVGLSNENTLVYWWRHDKPEALATSLKERYETVLCPRRPLYFDFVQHDTHTNGRRWDGFNPIQDVYDYPDSTHNFSIDESSFIKGIQACLWTETVTTAEWIDFLCFPRMLALSESAWTTSENKDYTRFEQLLPDIFSYLDRLDIYYFNNLDDAQRSEPSIESGK